MDKEVERLEKFISRFDNKNGEERKDMFKIKCEFSIGIDLKPNGEREYFLINKKNKVVYKFKDFFEAKGILDTITNGFVETPLN